MRRRIAGSTAVVTGASSGIGRATAIALARRGADVVLAARSESSLNEVAERCEEVGGRALVVPTDVSDEDAVRELARRAGERFGRIDTWVNGAAVIAYGELEEIPSDVYRQVVETNLFGQLHGARAALPWFRDRGEGVLINVASVWGQVSSPFVSPYVVSKFGVRALTECLQQALAADPAARAIRACLILPVSVDTPIFRHAANYLGREVKPVPPVLDPDRVVESILATIERPRQRVVVGWSGRLVAGLHAAAPQLFTAVIPHAMRLLALGREPVPGGSGNVFEPMPSWNRVHGGWTGERRRARQATIGGAAAVALLAGAVGLGRALGSRRS